MFYEDIHSFVFNIQILNLLGYDFIFVDSQLFSFTC